MPEEFSLWGKMMIKAMNKGHSSLTSWGLEHMNIERTATVLDIGCGGGKTGKLTFYPL